MGLARMELGFRLGMLRLGMELGSGLRLGMGMVGAGMVCLGSVLGVASVLLQSLVR